MAITASRHSEQGERSLYSDAAYIGGDVVFHRKHNPIRGSSISDMQGLKFGAVLSYDYTAEYRKAIEDGLISEVIVPNADLLFPMLIAKRFEVFVMDKTAGLYIYNMEYRGKAGNVITYLDQPLSTFEYSMRFSNDGEKSQRLVKIFNTSLKEMSEAGIIDQYYRDFEQGAYLDP